MCWQSATFLSTPPAWGATARLTPLIYRIHISIHAPRMGSDSFPMKSRRQYSNFYPRPPHGERPRACDRPALLTEFLSTPPAWGATQTGGIIWVQGEISIHAPRMGSDIDPLQDPDSQTEISIHAPRMGSDGEEYGTVQGAKISIHAPRMGSDMEDDAERDLIRNFYPRPPHGERQQTWRKKCPVCVCLLCKVRKHPNNSLKSRGLSPKFASPYIKLSKNLCILRCEPPGKIMSDHGSHYSPEESAF